MVVVCFLLGVIVVELWKIIELLRDDRIEARDKE